MKIKSTIVLSSLILMVILISCTNQSTIPNIPTSSSDQTVTDFDEDFGFRAKLVSTK
jgi:hypothetical protein